MNYTEQCDCLNYCDAVPCPACQPKPPESTLTRLRECRAKLDAAKAELLALKAEWRRRLNDWQPHLGQVVADSYRQFAAYAQTAAIENGERAEVLREKYVALAMELADEVCR